MSDAKAPSAWQIERVLATLRIASNALNDARSDGDAFTDATEAEFAELDVAEIGVRDVVKRLLLAADEAKHNTEAVKARRAALELRQARFANQHAVWKQTAHTLIDIFPELFPGRKFKDALVSARIQSGRAGVVVTDIDKLEARFVNTTKTAKLSEIATAIDDGEVVEGASKRNGADYLIVKTT